jgi:hypothetical protein
MRYDPGFKLLLSNAVLIEGLLQDCIGEDWIRHLDFTTLEQVHTDAPSDDPHADLNSAIWRLRWLRADGMVRWLYVHLLPASQAPVAPWTGAWVLTQVGRLYQELIRQDLVHPGSQLPPVVPILLYDGGEPTAATYDLDDVIEPVPGLEPYQPQMRWLAINEQRYYETAFRGARGIANSLLLAPTISADEVTTMLSERVKEWTEQWRQRGFEQGRLEEREACRRWGAGLVLRQLQRRLGVLPAALATPIGDLPLEHIEALGEALFDFNNVSDLQTWLGQR